MNPTTSVPVYIHETGEYTVREVPLLLAYTGCPLAITQCPDSALLTITHLPTGRSLPVAHHDQAELTMLVDRLAVLGEWPQSQEELEAMPLFCARIYATIESWTEVFQGGAV